MNLWILMEPQVFNDPQVFDDPKVYGDTVIFDVQTFAMIVDIFSK